MSDIVRLIKTAFTTAELEALTDGQRSQLIASASSIVKGKAVPVGTIRGNMIKTGDGWKYNKKSKEGKSTEEDKKEQPKSDIHGQIKGKLHQLSISGAKPLPEAYSHDEKSGQHQFDFNGDRGGGTGLYKPRRGEEDDDHPDFVGHEKVKAHVENHFKDMKDKVDVNVKNHEKGNFSVYVSPKGEATPKKESSSGKDWQKKLANGHVGAIVTTQSGQDFEVVGQEDRGNGKVFIARKVGETSPGYFLDPNKEYTVKKTGKKESEKKADTKNKDEGISKKDFGKGTATSVDMNDSNEVGTHKITEREGGKYYLSNDKYDKEFKNWGELEAHLKKNKAKIVGWGKSDWD